MGSIAVITGASIAPMEEVSGTWLDLSHQ
jgi:hypothetical protein